MPPLNNSKEPTEEDILNRSKTQLQTEEKAGLFQSSAPCSVIKMYFFSENNLVWPIKAQLISQSAWSQVSHPGDLS